MAPRTPLLHPERYFEARGFDLAPATGAVVAAALSPVLAFVGFGVVLADRFRSAGHPEAASAVWTVFGNYVVGIVFALGVAWVLTAGILHVLARAVVGHDGRFGETLAVAGWGTAPTVASSLVALALLVTVVGDAAMTSPEAFADQFSAELAGTGPLRTIVSFLVAVWQTYVYANGLAVAFEDDSRMPWVVGGAVAVVGWLLTLI
jgi:hypothetical protein